MRAVLDGARSCGAALVILGEPGVGKTALLNGEGLGNKQIGERLFVSHRTAGAHLYHVFAKLGIATRARLRDALEERDLWRPPGAGG